MSCHIAFRSGLAIVALAGASLAQAVPLSASLDNFTYSGTVTRYATLADAQNQTNPTGGPYTIQTVSNGPRNTRTDLTLDDGRRYACRIIDLSLSGAAVDIEVRPALGTSVQLGHMKGRVVRHFQEGVAIEFSSVQSREALTAFL